MASVDNQSKKGTDDALADAGSAAAEAAANAPAVTPKKPRAPRKVLTPPGYEADPPEDRPPAAGKKRASVARDPNMPAEEQGKMAAKVRGATAPDEQGRPTVALQPVYVSRQVIRRCVIWVVGLSPFISNKMNAKVVAMILRGHMQLPPEPRKAKDPFSDFLACIHYTPDGTEGIPGGAFKAAMVGACRQFGRKVNMTAIKQFFHILPDVVRVYGDVPRVCQHVVRNDDGTMDIRFRALFFRWMCGIPIEYDSELISVETMLALLQRAGFGVGVGDWRPGAPHAANGRCGRFRPAEDGDLIGAEFTQWCLENPVNMIELVSAGCVPDELVEAYKEAAKLPPPPPESDPAKPSKRKKVPADREEALEMARRLKELQEANLPIINSQTRAATMPAGNGNGKGNGNGPDVDEGDEGEGDEG
jgi:hypothetical protein